MTNAEYLMSKLPTSILGIQGWKFKIFFAR